jgi:hypothetical protein
VPISRRDDTAEKLHDLAMRFSFLFYRGSATWDDACRRPDGVGRLASGGITDIPAYIWIGLAQLVDTK